MRTATSETQSPTPGRSDPLGADWDDSGVNFALFSAHADAVTLCLFDADGGVETDRLALAREGDVWHGYLPGAAPGLVYGYRVDGRYAPEHGDWFNPHKLLVDPYARAITAGVRWNEANFSRDRRDNAAFIPKARVARIPAPARPGPRTAWTDTIIYELHVKGFTQTHPGVPAQDRGRFKGLAAPAILAHLHALGVTTLELLPIFPFADENLLVRKGLTNYWGYNPYAFFAVDPRYAGDLDEVRDVLDTLHAHGFEVILDVVYNHTAEGEELGQTLSLRGIDNRSYYKLDSAGGYKNYSGCGNTLATDHPQVQKLVLDSLRAWAHLGVDGFRFDLAPVLGRAPDDFREDAPLLAAIASDPALAHCKFIAEPWDAASYHLGQFPNRWAEWNDHYRDTMRRFWRGDAMGVGDAATRLAGSSDCFKAPTKSLNFITAHDGFTLRDLVSYAEKHNQANGENNRDGAANNLSRNWGAEGPTSDATVNDARGRQMRAMLATLFLSQGVPMLLAGDELGHSQGGNNNAYCQDNPVSWIDWTATDHGLLAFTQHLIAWRKGRRDLIRTDFFAGYKGDGTWDIRWLHPAGHEISGAEWNDRALHAFGFQSAENLVVLFNAGPTISFTLPTGRWKRVLDTSGASDGAAISGPFPLAGMSVAILEGGA